LIKKKKKEKKAELPKNGLFASLPLLLLLLQKS
jgi:hypothetical protein